MRSVLHERTSTATGLGRRRGDCLLLLPLGVSRLVDERVNVIVQFLNERIIAEKVREKAPMATKMVAGIQPGPGDREAPGEAPGPPGYTRCKAPTSDPATIGTQCKSEIEKPEGRISSAAT